MHGAHRPFIAEDDGAIVVAMTDDAADRLVDGPRRLLAVPVAAGQRRQHLWRAQRRAEGRRAGGTTFASVHPSTRFEQAYSAMPSRPALLDPHRARTVPGGRFSRLVRRISSSRKLRFNSTCDMSTERPFQRWSALSAAPLRLGQRTTHLGVGEGRVRHAGDDDSACLGVGKVDAFADLAAAHGEQDGSACLGVLVKLFQGLTKAKQAGRKGGKQCPSAIRRTSKRGRGGVLTSANSCLLRGSTTGRLNCFSRSHTDRLPATCCGPIEISAKRKVQHHR